MTILNSFDPFLQVFYLSMTEPTSRAFIELVSGWVFISGRSLADRIRAIDGERHRATYYRVLSVSSWSMSEVSLRLLKRFVDLMPQETLFLVGDDTFLPHKGSKIFGTGMHRDATLSTRGRTVKRWGHAWVVLSVVFESRRSPGRYFCLPVMVQLHINQTTADKLRRKYVKKSTQMIDLVKLVNRHFPQQKLHFIGDYGYTAPAFLKQFPERIAVTGRARGDARLYEPAPLHHGGRGRPRVRGPQLASPVELLQGRIPRREYTVASGRCYRVRQTSILGCFFQSPARLVRVVVLEHLRGTRENDVFYTTVTDAKIEQVVQWYAQRWSIEVTFRDCKQHLGVGREQNRTRGASRRTAAIGFLMYSLIVLWHETSQLEPPKRIRDYPGKRHPSFADMLATLRHETLAQDRKKCFGESAETCHWQKNYLYLEKLLLLAA